MNPDLALADKHSHQAPLSCVPRPLGKVTKRGGTRSKASILFVMAIPDNQRFYYIMAFKKKLSG